MSLKQTVFSILTMNLMIEFLNLMTVAVATWLCIQKCNAIYTRGQKSDREWETESTGLASK
jgi:hypothetical protein